MLNSPVTRGSGARNPVAFKVRWSHLLHGGTLPGTLPSRPFFLSALSLSLSLSRVELTVTCWRDCDLNASACLPLFFRDRD